MIHHAAFGLALWMSVSAEAAHADHFSLDGDWKFTYTRSTGADVPELPPASAFVTTIRIPGWWDEQLERMSNAPWFNQADFRETQGPAKYLAGIGWHRTTFQAAESWRGHAVTLTIGRAISIVHVWLNKRHIASYDYGVYTPFEVDLSRTLEYGNSNELVIAVDNTKGFAGGWAYLGNQGQSSGITESVSIKAASGPGRLAGLFIRPGKGLKEVEWNADLEVPVSAVPNRPSSIAWQLLDASKNKVISEGRVEVPAFEKTHHLSWRAGIDAIQPWSDRHPNLYWTRLRWLSGEGEQWDDLEQRFGLRRFKLDGRKLLLNDHPIYLRGCFGFYYFPIHCAPPTEKSFWQESIRRLKSMGFNYINFAAQVCPRGMLDAADEEGMILQCGDHQTVLEPYARYYEGVWTPLVRWTRTNPSMCIYGFGGERDYYEGIIEQYQRQYDLIKKLNPEALVMPQQAIRGIDYSFDAKGATELTKTPFRHHAERLARYTKACDLFGHYSGGALSYTYDKPPTWQGMDERFRIYSKPLSAHELFMGASHLNPENAARYTGRVGSYQYDDTRQRLQATGLLNKWPIYFENSVRLQSICAKYNLEKVRKCHELVAFELLGAFDMHALPFYTVGLLDEFLNFKPGNNARTYLPFNSENVLLIDYDQGESINRAYYQGEKFKADALLSLYGENDLQQGTFNWSLSHDGEVTSSGSFPVKTISIGQVASLGQVDLVWPEIKQTTKFELAFRLESNLASVSNEWNFWVFPNRPVPAVNAAADEKCVSLLTKRYTGLATMAEHPERRLHIVSSMTPASLSHLKDGGDVLLLGTDPFPINKDYSSFRSGLGDKPYANIGTILAKHPIFADLPNDGWADWHFYYVLDGAKPFIIDDAAMPTFNPILEVISPASHVRKQAAIFECRVGKGRLLASCCVNKLDNPACVALLDRIVQYVSSDQFQPKDTMDLDLKLLANYSSTPQTNDPNNFIPEHTFNRRPDVLLMWQPYGKGFKIDQQITHSGQGSMRLQLSPEQVKEEPGASVGAGSIVIKFDKAQRMRFSTWCRTQELSGEKGSDFQILLHVFYDDGTRGTFRLPLPTGTHDWHLVESFFTLEKEVDPDQTPMLYVSMSGKSGTVWLDDLYLGPAGERK